MYLWLAFSMKKVFDIGHKLECFVISFFFRRETYFTFSLFNKFHYILLRLLVCTNLISVCHTFFKFYALQFQDFYADNKFS